MSDFDRDVEQAFQRIAGGGVRIRIHLVGQDSTFVWPFEVPFEGARLLEMHAAGDARVHFEFPDDTEEYQKSWPKGCPYAEEELRARIEDFLKDVLGFQRKVQEFRRALPETPYRPERPSSIYDELVSALDHLEGEHELDYRSMKEGVAGALASTPAALRADWLRRQLGRKLRCLLPSEEAESDS